MEIKVRFVDRVEGPLVRVIGRNLREGTRIVWVPLPARLHGELMDSGNISQAVVGLVQNRARIPHHKVPMIHRIVRVPASLPSSPLVSFRQADRLLAVEHGQGGTDAVRRAWPTDRLRLHLADLVDGFLAARPMPDEAREAFFEAVSRVLLDEEVVRGFPSVTWVSFIVLLSKALGRKPSCAR